MHSLTTPAILMAAVVVNAYTVIDHDLFLTKNMDPIVYPGQYKSHMHSFFGSDGVSVNLPTSADLQASCYSGDNPNDMSVYWMPTLYHVDGDTYTPVPINRFSTYYNNIGDAEIPFPQDMYSVAGDASARDQSGVDYDNNGMSWWCEGDPAEDKDGGKFPTTTCSTHMQTILRFPDCINTEDFSQRAYSPCPEGMKRIPQLRFSVRYDLRKILPDGWSGTPPLQLACSDTIGDGYCFHGDFINGWFEDALDFMMISASDKNDFMFVSGSHGSAATPSSCTPTDSDPDNGTSDYATSLEMMGDGSTSTTNDTVATTSKCKRDNFVERRQVRSVNGAA